MRAQSFLLTQVQETLYITFVSGKIGEANSRETSAVANQDCLQEGGLGFLSEVWSQGLSPVGKFAAHNLYPKPHIPRFHP